MRNLRCKRRAAGKMTIAMAVALEELLEPALPGPVVMNSDDPQLVLYVDNARCRPGSRSRDFAFVWRANRPD